MARQMKTRRSAAYAQGTNRTVQVMMSSRAYKLEPMLYIIVRSLAHMNLEIKVMINTNYYTQFVLCVNSYIVV